MARKKNQVLSFEDIQSILSSEDLFSFNITTRINFEIYKTKIVHVKFNIYTTDNDFLQEVSKVYLKLNSIFNNKVKIKEISYKDSDSKTFVHFLIQKPHGFNFENALLGYRFVYNLHNSKKWELMKF